MNRAVNANRETLGAVQGTNLSPLRTNLSPLGTILSSWWTTLSLSWTTLSLRWTELSAGRFQRTRWVSQLIENSGAGDVHELWQFPCIEEALRVVTETWEGNDNDSNRGNQ